MHGSSSMRPCATYDDVSLVLRLYEIRRESRMRDARRWFVKECKVKTLAELDALCPVGSVENESFRMVTSYWDMCCSFIAGGVLQPDIFFESNREALLVWERIRDVVPAIRERYEDPKYLGNLEQVADLFVEWMGKRGPNAYAAFSKRMRS
ncbi:MAG TPA: hypothetical protein VLA37_05140 [Sphingomonadaceae bacterium]|nr:hypothetical protein [Sphingomonadaceae bacterium]